MNNATDSSVYVRTAGPEDAEVLAWFNRAMALETEGRELDGALVRSGVEAVFAGGDKGFYVVAERSDRIVGGLLVTYEWSDWRNALFWWIQSVYVRPDSRRLGVYRAMHGYVASKAAERGDVCGVRLYVDKDNHLAQQVYAGLGMRQTRYEMFEVEFEERSGNQQA